MKMDKRQTEDSQKTEGEKRKGSRPCTAYLIESLQLGEGQSGGVRKRGGCAELAADRRQAMVMVVGVMQQPGKTSKKMATCQQQQQEDGNTTATATSR